MNIKYIALLSFSCVAGINAITLNKNLDDAKKELQDCRSSVFRLNCNNQEKAYNTAKQEFLKIHYANESKGISENHYNQQYKNIPLIGNLIATIHNKRIKEHALLKAWGSSSIIEALGEGYPVIDYFEHSNKTIKEFCNEIIDTSMNKEKYPHQPTYVNKIVGREYITSADQSSIDVAKQTLKDIIEKQSQ
jgi:hypothetical protein